MHEAISAANTLKGEGVNIRVVDLFTLKPIDSDTILACAKATNGKILTVEDHYYEGAYVLTLYCNIYRLTLMF